MTVRRVLAVFLVLLIAPVGAVAGVCQFACISGSTEHHSAPEHEQMHQHEHGMAAEPAIAQAPAMAQALRADADCAPEAAAEAVPSTPAPRLSLGVTALAEVPFAQAAAALDKSGSPHFEVPSTGAPPPIPLRI